jgi:hypothetical protein
MTTNLPPLASVITKSPIKHVKEKNRKKKKGKENESTLYKKT